MKKRIYSGKKYKKEYYSGPNEWSWSYKFEGQKTFWAMTDESPEEYEIRIKSEKITIKYKSKEYTLEDLIKIREEIKKEYVSDYERNELKSEKEVQLKKSANSWKSNLRTKRRKGKLEQEKVDKLNRLGMVWNPTKSDWDKKFLYFKKNGLDTDIEEWIVQQRKIFHEGEMPKENYERLKAFDFPFDDISDDMFKITNSTVYGLIEKLENKRKRFESSERRKLKG